jgi:hypothetical protein
MRTYPKAGIAIMITINSCMQKWGITDLSLPG